MNFIYINQNILDNLFYILVSILIYSILLDHGKRLSQYSKTLITVCMSIPIILCMKFPIYIDEYCVHDLRQIPFIIGTLYGGWPVGAALLVIILTFRFAFYGFNLLTLIVYIVIFIITALFSSKFKNFNRKNKLNSSILLILILGILTSFISLVMSDYFRITEAYVFYFIILPPFIIVLAVYIMEILKDAILIRTQMVRLEKMEIVSQLAASISHEIRNPLTVVKGFVQLLKAPDLSQEVKEQYIEHVVRELNSAESIISEYLAFAKPAIEKVDNIFINREIGYVIEMIKPLANMNLVNISEQLTPGITRGNIQHFKQCFINLIKNGIEAMPNGGELSIVSYENNFDIIIEISDNGIGMNKEQINRFGEPYYSCKEKGTGLGSMLAVKTIQTMNGTLNINSVSNKGTTITVTLPAYHEDYSKK
ncbi:ATP-binding protein [Peribacillus butanolivorans]|uniref:histidine kinase n=1 Tax=Peribacillus butanolivorans TaxID=421767 RepID=A0AAX0S336_9BACI|nr:ATP-binding protein [Peribacillus butanolivorans]PEJ31721.1 two-component sensor histidine kinase [Peribacillus butanolivorans]QNU06259.1 sensor histidine kinase [Peribacillus butanolivorans]